VLCLTVCIWFRICCLNITKISARIRFSFIYFTTHPNILHPPDVYTYLLLLTRDRFSIDCVLEASLEKGADLVAESWCRTNFIKLNILEDGKVHNFSICDLIYLRQKLRKLHRQRASCSLHLTSSQVANCTEQLTFCVTRHHGLIFLLCFLKY
jgi:hypothetical protein